MTQRTTTNGGMWMPPWRRKGHFRYYVRVALRNRSWHRFWVARWFWSGGRIGPVPQGYSKDYWQWQ